jgi:hypothetical protein
VGRRQRFIPYDRGTTMSIGGGSVGALFSLTHPLQPLIGQ